MTEFILVICFIVWGIYLLRITYLKYRPRARAGVDYEEYEMKSSDFKGDEIAFMINSGSTTIAPPIIQADCTLCIKFYGKGSGCSKNDLIKAFINRHSNEQISYALKRLLDRELITKRGMGRNTRYYPGVK